MNTALLLLADGRFPTGGHANSAGVEAAMSVGDATDIVALRRYLAGRLATTGELEASFAAAACARFEVDAPLDALQELDRELDARTLSPRAREVSRRLGRQLLRVGRSTWPHPVLDELAVAPGAHQAIAFGALTAAAGGSAEDAARLAVHHLAAAVTGAAVRVLGLDPLEAARLQAEVAPTADGLAASVDQWATCAAADLPAAGGALSEILAEDHGTWTARLFVG